EVGLGGGGRSAPRRKTSRPGRYSSDNDNDDTVGVSAATTRSVAVPSASSTKRPLAAWKVKVEAGSGGANEGMIGEGSTSGEKTTHPPPPTRSSGRIRIKLHNDNGGGGGGEDRGEEAEEDDDGVGVEPSAPTRGRLDNGVAALMNVVVATAADEDVDDDEEEGEGGGTVRKIRITLDDPNISDSPVGKTVRVRVVMNDDPSSSVPPPTDPTPPLYAVMEVVVLRTKGVDVASRKDDDDVDGGLGAVDVDATEEGGDDARREEVERATTAGEEGLGSIDEGLVDAGEAADAAKDIAVEVEDVKGESVAGEASSSSSSSANGNNSNAADDADLLPGSSPGNEQRPSKSLSRGKYCAHESCTRYRQTGCYGYCLTHRHLSDPMVHAHRREAANAQSFEKKRLMKNRSNLCKWPDCLKYIQSNCHGYCLTHVKYADYMGSGGTNEGEFYGGGGMGGEGDPADYYDDDLLYEITKVRVRVQQRLQNGFCRAILPMELRDKWGFIRGGGDEEEEYGTNLGMPDGNDDEYDEHHGDEGRGGIGVVVGEEEDVLPSAPSADATASVPAMDEDDVPPKVGVEDEADADTDDAAARLLRRKLHDDMLDFAVSSTSIKKFNGSLKCRAVSCPKNCQGNSDGFCRAHHNQYLICTGQCESWVCVCGNKIVDFMARCGTCHRWRGGKHPLSSMPSAGKKLKNNAGDAVEMPLTYVPPDADVQISETQLTNSIGRSLCKVIGCGKLDQSYNDGFCRMHFNMFAVLDAEGDDADLESWICVCGQTIRGSQKRCGNCNKWKGGKREPYEINKGNGLSEENIIYDENNGEPWTCDCGNVVPGNKSRCGGCHHWRGGRRQGGWKLGSIGREYDSDDGVDRTQDWTCCDAIIPAQQTRCGKCNGWRGGKRIAGGASMAMAVPSNLPPWLCIKCHISNPGNKRRCGGCLTWKSSVQNIKSSKPSKPKATFGSVDIMGEGSSTSGGHWQCKKCNFDNFASELECFVCQTTRPNYQWHKNQQIVSSSTPTATVQHGTGQAAASAVVTVTPQPYKSVASASPAAVTAFTSQLPATGGNLILSVTTQGVTSTIDQGKNILTSTHSVASAAPITGNCGNGAVSISRLPDALNYYGTYDEGLEYPYISIHYDFNRAYYHNHDYTYLNACASRTSCVSSDSLSGECK
ncbi:hypothetical protein ACHAXA_000113, partial [Cyclostephanos tholiformis]